MCLNLLFQQKHSVLCLTPNQGKKQAHTPPSLLLLFFTDNHSSALLLVSVPAAGSRVSASPYQMFSHFHQDQHIINQLLFPSSHAIMQIATAMCPRGCPSKFRRNDNIPALSPQLLPQLINISHINRIFSITGFLKRIHSNFSKE